MPTRNLPVVCHATLERCVTSEKTAARESMASDAYLKKPLNLTTSIQEDRVFTAGKKNPL